MKENIIVAARVILLPLLIICTVIHVAYNYRHHKPYHLHVKTGCNIYEKPLSKQELDSLNDAIQQQAIAAEYLKQWDKPTHTGPSVEQQAQQAQQAMREVNCNVPIEQVPETNNGITVWLKQ